VLGRGLGGGINNDHFGVLLLRKPKQEKKKKKKPRRRGEGTPGDDGAHNKLIAKHGSHPVGRETFPKDKTEGDYQNRMNASL